MSTASWNQGNNQNLTYNRNPKPKNTGSKTKLNLKNIIQSPKQTTDPTKATSYIHKHHRHSTNEQPLTKKKTDNTIPNSPKPPPTNTNHLNPPRTARTEPQSTKLVPEKMNSSHRASKNKIGTRINRNTPNWIDFATKNTKLNKENEKDRSFCSPEVPDLEDRRRSKRGPLPTPPCDGVLIYFLSFMTRVEFLLVNLRGRWAGGKRAPLSEREDSGRLRRAFCWMTKLPLFIITILNLIMK